MTRPLVLLNFTTHLSFGIAIIIALLLLIFVIACCGPPAMKRELKALFAMKAPATVLALFWKDAIVHTAMLIFLGSGDGPLYEDTVHPDSLGDDFRAWVLKLSNVGSFVLLCLTMVPLIKVSNSCLGNDWLAEHRSLLIASFHMSPVWSFKGFVQNLIALLDAKVTADPLWLYDTLYALGLTLICAAFAMVGPAFRVDQCYCVAVVALAAASLHAGVAFAFNDIAQVSAGDRWHDIPFQAVYTPACTLLCLGLGSVFHGLFQSSSSSFVKQLTGFLRLVPGFVAAWAWQALGQAIAKEYWPEPDGAWDKTERQLVLASIWGIVALAMVFAQLMVAALPCLHAPIVHEIFTTIAGANVGWAWKSLATDLYAAWGSRFRHLWLLTAVLSVALPVLAACLLLLMPESPLAADPLIEDNFSEEEPPAPDGWCGCFRSHKVDGRELRGSPAPVTTYVPLKTTS